ncbi:MAG: hypothetical protein HY077_16195 [Elusimicrobia bacterium]|nr:hypothetical protein [Elusimicrobiota bacterium]
MKKALACGLTAAIILCAPGLVPYQAVAAANFNETPGGQIRIIPKAAPEAGLTGPELKVPGVPTAGELPGTALPGTVVPELGAVVPGAEPGATMVSPTGPASKGDAPTILGGTEKLVEVVAPEGSVDPAAQQAALTRTYTTADHPEYDPGDPNAILAVTGKDQDCSAGGCPFAKLFGKSSRAGSGASKDGTPAPSRPKPDDVGRLHKAAMHVMAGTWWVWDRAINQRWDKMPSTLAAIYLYFNEQYLRLHLWDANSEPSTDKTTYGPATEEQKKYRTADGSYFDPKDPAMAKAGSRFNHLRKPDGPPNPDWAKMEPNPFVISEKLMQRDHDAQGKPIIKEIPANLWFQQIQDQLHDWFNHEQEPLSDRPISFTVPKGHPLKPEGGTVIINRTKTDSSVPADYKGPAIHRNAETSPWDKSSLYGSSKETQDKVRSFEGGHLKIGADGYLPDDSAKPGVPQTGFNNNMSVDLALHNVIWAHEHNLVADAINSQFRAKGIQLSDEELFQKARLRITGVNARNHTVPWTQWLFAGSKTGQEIMWADWYGFFGKRFKLAYMRWTDRHPFLAKFTDPFIRLELLFGIPGTKTTHYGKRYNFTEEFVDVYRLHQLVRDMIAVQHLQPNADGTYEIHVIDSVKLRDRVGKNTQTALRSHSLEDWGLTMGREKVGELTINNIPDDLRNLTAQDGAKDGHKIDLGAIDIIRTRERLEASTFVKFTMRLGQRPPRTFEELTGGNKAAAAKLRGAYKNVKDVDFQIGILAEWKPIGFALGDKQFKVFVLSAPGRLKNDPLLSSLYNDKTYDGGIDYMETNNWGNIVARVIPGLKALEIEAMKNPYMAYPEPGWLPKALAQDSQDARQKLGSVAFRGWIVAGATAIAALVAGIHAAPLVALGVLAAMVGNSLSLEGLDAARSDMTEAKTIAQIDAAASKASHAALTNRAAAVTLTTAVVALAWVVAATSPVIAGILALAAVVTAVATLKKAGAAAAAVRLQGAEIKARLRKDAPHIDPATLPGETSIQKRYWFLLGDKKSPVATFRDSYKALRGSGLSAWKAFVTAAFSHMGMARRTQRNMTAQEKARYKPGFFDLYVPNIIAAHGYSNSRVYVQPQDAKATGLKAGDLNMAEFDRIFRDFGALRGYVTAYDLSRLRDANEWRDKQEDRGNAFTRLLGRLAAKRRAEQLIELFADRVVWEDGLPGGRVPAISRERMLQFYQGSAEAELNREREGK